MTEEDFFTRQDLPRGRFGGADNLSDQKQRVEYELATLTFLGPNANPDQRLLNQGLIILKTMEDRGYWEVQYRN